jgi:hypothetical protein
VADKTTPANDVLADLIQRYGKQIIQLFGALAGAVGIFYVIGFMIVNVHLLTYGVFEAALPQVGYVAPGVSFVILVLIMTGASIVLFTLTVRGAEALHVPKLIGGVLGIALTLGAGALLASALWSLRGASPTVFLFLSVIGLVTPLLIFSEQLPLVHRLVRRVAHDSDDSPTGLQRRLQSPAFISTTVALLFAAVLSYGQYIYNQIPPVFGGGQPIVVRFYGPDVAQLTTLGIPTEPGQMNLTERVSLIAQTSDRYIVVVDHCAGSYPPRR